MTHTRLIPTLACALILSACASGGQGSGSAKPAPTMAGAMSDADAAVLSGQTDKAYTILKTAATTFPADKTPWQRMAQMRFDAGNYGEAIVNGLEALERDPNDNLSNSIVAVAGLRVSTKALADLTEKNNLTGNVRSEAQDLAKLLRTALNEEKLVPASNTRSIVKPKSGRRTDPPPAQVRETAAASSDPFGALK
jgi:predicted Zn-dependent protease